MSTKLMPSDMNTTGSEFAYCLSDQDNTTNGVCATKGQRFVVLR